MIPGEGDHRTEAVAPDGSKSGFRQLAAFRRHIRQFLHFSEEVARSHGIEPLQHQLLLTIKGLPQGRPTIPALCQPCVLGPAPSESLQGIVQHSRREHRKLV